MRKFKAQRYAATHARAKPRLTLATDVLPRARLGEHTEKKRGEAMAKKKKQNSASTPATTVLEKLGISFETVSYEHDADHMDKGYSKEQQSWESTPIKPLKRSSLKMRARMRLWWV